jgi:mxaJ protein
MGLHRFVSAGWAGGVMAMLALAACSDSRAAPRVASADGDRAAPADARPAVASALRPESPAVAAARRGELRVCADPNNLPFSNQAGEGFENQIAQLLAREMGRRVTYTWWAQRRGFIRNTLKAGECDLITGVPSSLEMVLATRPYYRSTYVFVYRSDAGFDVRSFDDPVLRRKRIGVQLVGDDYANTPPAHALAARGIVGNVKGYTLYGDYAEPNPPARILDALARGEIDVAIVWGPLAGYFAPREHAALKIVPVSPQVDVPFLPFVFDISMGVRRGDVALAAEVERILRARRAGVDSILDRYGVPRVDPRPGAAE